LASRLLAVCAVCIGVEQFWNTQPKSALILLSQLTTVPQPAPTSKAAERGSGGRLRGCTTEPSRPSGSSHAGGESRGESADIEQFARARKPIQTGQKSVRENCSPSSTRGGTEDDTGGTKTCCQREQALGTSTRSAHGWALDYHLIPRLGQRKRN
jgi:hypothetical protein